ncbi:hypothetical protein LOZ58_004739 [Ophidiomyces ophidiicola]|nr:hypothetical protein LOZ58_004739 [Ophidiomyces ophidiicola]
MKYSLLLADPDMPSPRYHTTVVVLTDGDNGGYVHHVTGDLVSANGMKYECKRCHAPEKSTTFYSQELLGVTDADKHPQAWEDCLRKAPAPPRQKAFNPITLKTEPFKTANPLTFYEPDEPRRPLIKCTENGLWSKQFPHFELLGLSSRRDIWRRW